MNKNQNSLIADGSLLLVAVIWGSGFTATQMALDSGFLPLTTMALRFGMAALLMSIIFIKKLKNIKKEDIKSGAVVGFFLFTAFASQTVGLQFTTPSKNAFLTATNVILVPFIYWFMTKKKPDIYSVIAAFACIFGIAFISLGRDLTLGIGDSLSLLCALLFAFHISSTGFYSQKRDTTILTITQMWFAAILSFLGAFFTESFPKVVPVAGIFSVIYIGIFSTMLAFFIQTTAQRHTSPTKAAIILSTEALFGTIFSVIILKEIITFKMIVGGICIFLAIITAETKWKFLYKRKIKIIESDL
ncbi:DMT family transporter [uncultured Ilyobacter sp.]|uniref:DMT family transporter n=1 Tax=uncultured Ilyobacter sp. TaxID=544433 RepID=UPI0029C8F1E3|nr:DMT family transporter [uncultured Ilyobacter sp.]